MRCADHCTASTSPTVRLARRRPSSQSPCVMGSQMGSQQRERRLMHRNLLILKHFLAMLPQYDVVLM